jgi:hypothetical protein
VSRMIVASTMPPYQPLTPPRSRPIENEIRMPMSPTVSETRAPNSRRLSTSRPVCVGAQQMDTPRGRHAEQMYVARDQARDAIRGPAREQDERVSLRGVDRVLLLEGGPRPVHERQVPAARRITDMERRRRMEEVFPIDVGLAVRARGTAHTGPSRRGR